MSPHDQAEALTLSDRIAVLAGGRLRQVAPPREIYDDPADAFVAGFVGENNRLPGRVRALADGVCRVALEGGWDAAARAAPGLSLGDDCLLMVRPERLALGAPGGLPATLAEALSRATTSAALVLPRRGGWPRKRSARRRARAGEA